MSLRIGIVDYLNSWPLAWGFLSGRLAAGYDAIYCSPAEVADRLAEGDLEVGLIPSIELQRIDDLRVVPGLCVAATHEVRSVLLVSKGPVEAIRRLALDENSRTSAALARIVLVDKYGIEPQTVVCAPRIEEMLSDADAALLIGDPALQVDRERFRILDLAAEWRELTGRPFVFAVWAVRSNVDTEGLVAALSSSLGSGLEAMETIIRRAVDRLDLPRDVVERYLLRHLNFVMGPDELAGLEEFFRRASAHRAIEGSRPLRFARS